MNGGKLFKMHAAPVEIDMQFTVAGTNGDGISSLSGPTVSNVWMHCSTTASSGNPNPAAGTIVIRLQDNYNELLGAQWMIIQSPNSGSDVKIDNSAMTAGVAYTITTLGNATAAKWHAIGVPAGITPAVGVSFIAASNGGTGNTLTSAVQASATAGSGVAAIEALGADSIAPAPSANQGYGAQIILQCYDYAGAKVAPADGSIISVKLLFNNSSLRIQGS